MPFGGGRTPDKPGTFRIKAKGNGQWRLSGVREDGTRYRQTFATESEAQRLAGVLFPAKNAAPQPTWSEVDDFGLPVPVKSSPENMASANAKLGIGTPTGAPAPMPSLVAQASTAVSKAAEESKLKKAEQASSLMEMVGLGIAAGDVALSVKLCERAGKVPVKPNPKQVNAFADATTETLKGWFGDREIKPWQMMILLGMAIPASMLMQSKPKKEETADSSKPSAAKSTAG